MATRTIPVTGMTCASCEQRVAGKLIKVQGVREVTVAARRGRATVVADPMPTEATLADAVRAAGYGVGSDHRRWLSPDRRVWRDVGLGALAVAAIVVVAQVTGLGGLLGRVGGLSPSGLGVVLLIGLAAGLSTCMALVGGLVLALSARHAQQHPDARAWERLRPQLVFNVGRLIGFGALGAVLGVVGSAFTLSDRAVGVLLLAAAVVLVVLGTRLTGISPRVAGATVTVPVGLARLLRIEGRERRRYSDRNAALLGALTFFLPCGFTQTVQLFALSTGHPATAAGVMAVFALGTAPGLLGLGSVTSLARGKAAGTVFAVAGVAVLAFGFVNARAGLTNLGIRFGGEREAVSAQPRAPSTNVYESAGKQQLLVTQSYDGYSPARSVVYADMPIRWVVRSTAQLSCPAALRAPAVGVRATLQEGDNIFELPPQHPGTIQYHCAMGMYSGDITVIARPDGHQPGHRAGDNGPREPRS